MKFVHACCKAIIFSALFLVCLPSYAADDSPKARAKALFQEGVKLYRSEDYAEAANKFKAANKIFPTWKIHFNIAQCEVLLKNYGRALEAFEAYLIEGGDAVPEMRQQEVRKEISRLRDMTGDLSVKAPEGSVILIDGIERARAPMAGSVLVGAGMHELKVVLADETLLQREIKIHGRKSIEVEVKENESAAAPPAVVITEPEGPPAQELEPAEEPNAEQADAPTEPLEDEGTDKRIVAGSVLAAVGGAALIAGVVTGVMSRSKTKELEDNCPDKVCSDPADEDLHDEAHALSVTTDVLIPTGAVLAVTGAVLVILGLRADGEDEDGPDAALAPALGQGQFGLGLEGRF